MEFRVIELPAFRAASSGVDCDCDFSPSGKLGRFDAYFSAIRPSARDAFMPRDFLYYDEAAQGMVWLWALAEGMTDGGFDVVDFEGGYYLAYAYRDGNDADARKLHDEALRFIAASGALKLDVRPGHYELGHIITPAPVAKAQGWSQMEAFIPVRLR